MIDKEDKEIEKRRLTLEIPAPKTVRTLTKEGIEEFKRAIDKLDKEDKESKEDKEKRKKRLQSFVIPEGAPKATKVFSLTKEGREFLERLWEAFPDLRTVKDVQDS